jgi:hypothetical protein
VADRIVLDVRREPHDAADGGSGYRERGKQMAYGEHLSRLSAVALEA